MARVFDALRRAEEERKRRAGDATTPVVPLEVEPAGQTRQAQRKRRFFRRWRARREDPGTSELNKRRITLLQPDSYVAEQYRALRGRIDALAAQKPIRTIAVTSALANEGKTTAAVNLAVVTALSLGRRVLLVDCDLRRPKVNQTLGLRPEAGLTEVLTDATGLDQAIVKVEGINLEVLSVHGRPPNPSELLGSGKMREFMEEATRRYDRVILDTPAVLSLPDAKAASELCDGVVFVVRADRTRQEDIEAALEFLDRHRVLGFLLNGLEGEPGKYGYTS